MVSRMDAVLFGAVWKVGCFHDQTKADEGIVMLCARDSKAIKSGYQRKNASFSFWCGVNELVFGSWNCHV